MDTQPNPLENFVIFQQFASFLSQNDLFKVITLSKLYYHHGMKYLKILLREQGLLEHIDLQVFKRDNISKSLKQQSEPQSRHESHNIENQEEMLLHNQEIQEDQFIKAVQKRNIPVPYNLVYKHFYGRETLLAPLFAGPDKEKMLENLKPFRRTHTLGYAAKELKIGQRFTAFLTYNNQLNFCLSSEYIERVYPKPQMHRVQNVKKFSVLGKNQLLYLTFDGEVYVVFYESEKKEIFQNVIPITQQVPVVDFDSSFFLTVLIFNLENKDKQDIDNFNLRVNQLIFSSVQSNQQPQIPQNPIEENIIGLVLFMNELNILGIEQSLRYRKIIGYPHQTVRSLCAGAQNFYLLAPDGKIYQSESSSNSVSISANQNSQLIFDLTSPNVETPSVKVVLNEFFTKRHVVALYSGMQYFFALAREVIEPIEKWSSAELVAWFNSLGFEDYSRVIKYNEWTGAELLLQLQDKKFMKETLGLTREDLSIKLATEIKRASQKKYKSYQLLGWGRNDYGQLGTTISSNVQIAQNIPLPKFDSTDEIEKIECGWKNAVILTKKGKIFMTEIQSKTNKIETIQKVEEQKDSKKSNNNKKKYSQEIEDKPLQLQSRKKSKNIQENQESKQTLPQNNRWIDITVVFTKLKDSREYQKFDICLSKDYIAVTCVCIENQYLNHLRKINVLSPLKIEHDANKKKFKTGAQILDRILWDPQLNINDFTVGYEDRFLGIMEISVDEYQASEVKAHRIQYFRQKDKIVWDRKTKLNLLND